MPTRNRLLAVLISGVFAATSLAIAPPASANGCIGSRFPSGDGSAGSPYEIADAGHLIYLASDTNCFGYNYRQTANIVLTGAISTIGNTGNQFTKTYDGGGFSISNVNISLPSTDDVGLFGYINGATITGVNITSGSVAGRDNVGGLVGRALNSSITLSSSAASVTGANQVGGLVGDSAWVTGSNRSLSQAFATGSVTASGNYIGGLAGKTGYLVISNTYATGTVTGNFQVGGLIGENAYSSVSDAYATGLVTAGAASNAQGGLFGQEDTGTYDGLTWDIETTGQTQSENNRDVVPTGSTTAEMKTIDNFTSRGWSIGSAWTGNTTWVICPQANNGYPFLSVFYTAQTAPCVNSSGPPPDVMQQVGRAGDQTCASAGNAELNIGGVESGGWGQSWAQWMNGGTGGFVCNRTLFYNTQNGRWEVRT